LCFNFSSKEVHSIPINDRFPDIEFRGAKFEIKEMMDPNRRRHDELKRDLEKLKQIKTTVRDLIEPYSPKFVTFPEVSQKITPVLDHLCSKYPERQRADANLLIYFNLQEIILDKKGKWTPIGLDRQGWQSVSVVSSSWCYVFDSSADAPQFIVKNGGKFCQKTGIWEWPDRISWTDRCA
jgi:hypothetical protein